jgi:hypothetical protein
LTIFMTFPRRRLVALAMLVSSGSFDMVPHQISAVMFRSAKTGAMYVLT